MKLYNTIIISLHSVSVCFSLIYFVLSMLLFSSCDIGMKQISMEAYTIDETLNITAEVPNDFCVIDIPATKGTFIAADSRNNISLTVVFLDSISPVRSDHWTQDFIQIRDQVLKSSHCGTPFEYSVIPVAGWSGGETISLRHLTQNTQTVMSFFYNEQGKAILIAVVSIPAETKRAFSSTAVGLIKKIVPTLDFQEMTFLNEFLRHKEYAERGNPKAQNALGFCYENGEGVNANQEQAVYWYRKAAEQDDVIAQFNLGVCYENGEGVDANQEQAVYWYHKAAEQDYVAAQLNLAVCYEKGAGVNKDLAEAIDWYRKAAEQGNAVAQFILGAYYEDGIGVEKDLSKAIEWYRKAAEQGNATAEKHLGLLLLRILMPTNGQGGRGVWLEYYYKLFEKGTIPYPPDVSSLPTPDTQNAKLCLSFRDLQGLYINQ